MRAAKVDANQPAIVAEFRRLGASVQVLSTVGQGCPDILVGYQGENLLCEIKHGEKPPSARKLTPDQVKWHSDWRGSVHIVETLDDVRDLLRLCDIRVCPNDDSR